MQVPNAINDAWGKGGEGTMELARLVKDACHSVKLGHIYPYKLEDTVEEKINSVATKVYGAKGIILSDTAKDKIKTINKFGLNNLPIVIAKTQYSLSDDQKLIGAPENFDITIRDIEIRSGAGFLVAIAGSMMLMPGLGKTPAAINMTISNDGVIRGLF